MKKTLIVLGCMSLGLAHAQQNGRDHAQHQTPDTRVGINTENPVATLELKKVEGLPATQVQGFLLPHLTQTERNAFTKEALVNGLMIFNTTKNCIDWWDGANWQCQNGTQKDDHGDEYGKYRATFSYTATEDFMKECPADKRGGKITYTDTIIGKAISNTSQEEADRLAEENAKAEFKRLGKEKADRESVCHNTIGRCQNFIDQYPNADWVILDGINSVVSYTKGRFDYDKLASARKSGIGIYPVIRTDYTKINLKQIYGGEATKCENGTWVNSHFTNITSQCVWLNSEPTTERKYDEDFEIISIYPQGECDVYGDIPNNGTGNFGENSWINHGAYT